MRYKVYVVSLWTVAGLEDIMGVFSSRELAEAFRKKLVSDPPDEFNWVRKLEWLEEDSMCIDVWVVDE